MNTPIQWAEVIRVARLYESREEIFRNVRWRTLVELASTSTSAEHREKLEARILTNERVTVSKSSELAPQWEELARPGRLRPDVASPPPEQISRPTKPAQAAARRQSFLRRDKRAWRQCARKQKSTTRIKFRRLEAPVPQYNGVHHEKRSRIQYFCIGCWGDASRCARHCCYIHSITHGLPPRDRYRGRHSSRGCSRTWQSA